MALYIRDESVDALASELQKIINAPTKKEAVQIALRNELRRARRALPLKERLTKAIALADAMGPGDPDFDMKRFSDEMWDNL